LINVIAAIGEFTTLAQRRPDSRSQRNPYISGSKHFPRAPAKANNQCGRQSLGMLSNHIFGNPRAPRFPPELIQNRTIVETPDQNDVDENPESARCRKPPAPQTGP